MLIDRRCNGRSVLVEAPVDYGFLPPEGERVTMKGRQVYEVCGNRLRFPTLRDVGNIDAKTVDLPTSPEPFGQANESGGMRRVSSLEEVCEIASEAAARTKRRFGITS